LDTLTIDDLLDFPERNGVPIVKSIGTLILRVTGHHWFHNGEKAPYRPKTGWDASVVERNQ
jgi:hypothetical protein